jgi:general secretion pathway protein B
MSYILDALRKSDLQRQHAKAPTLLTPHTVPAEPAPRRLGLHAALAVALIGAGMLIGWLRPWQSPSVATPTATPIQTPHRETALSAPEPAWHAAEPDRADASQTPVRDNMQASTPINTQAEVQTQAHADTVSQANPPAPSAANAPPRAPAASPTPTPTSQAGDGKPPSLADLPADLRRDIPDMLIAFHQYADAPEQRRVMINNLLLRPGEFIAPGLKLEQITPDGVEVSYQGRRFRRGVR